MDRNRLSQVQQKDLTESRLNEDFLFWLKGSGSNYAVVILLGACAFLGWEWYKKSQLTAKDTAWSELAAATTPTALREVVAKHGKFDGVQMMALLQVGEGNLLSVQRGLRYDREPADADAALTRDLRDEYLNDADAAYAEVEAQAASATGISGAPLLIPALLGRASVAECRGDFAAAKSFLEKAKAAATPHYPVAGVRAQARLDSLAGLSTPYPMPEASSLPAVIQGGVPSEQDALNTLLGTTAPTPPAAPPSATP